MTAPVRTDPPALDEQVRVLAAQTDRTWGPVDAALGVLAVPAALALGLVALTVVPALGGGLATALSSLVLTVLVLAASRRAARQSGGLRRALGADLPGPGDVGQVLGWAALLLAAQTAALGVLTALVPALRGVPVDNISFLREQGLATVLVVIVSAVLVAPVLEELLFRGLVLRGLMLRVGFWPAALVSSVFFGLFHAQTVGVDALPLVAATGVFGLGLCVLVRRTGRLGPAIGVHALRNSLAVGVVLLG